MNELQLPGIPLVFGWVRRKESIPAILETMIRRSLNPKPLPIPAVRIQIFQVRIPAKETIVKKQETPKRKAISKYFSPYSLFFKYNYTASRDF
jgi:hypothetical protein